MPTYQYACTACSEPFEVVQSFSDAPLTECPTCGGALRKVFSPVGIVFKGSGFYKTDSRKPALAANGANGANGADGKSDDKLADKSGDKPAADKPAADKPASSDGAAASAPAAASTVTKTPAGSAASTG